MSHVLELMLQLKVQCGVQMHTDHFYTFLTSICCFTLFEQWHSHTDRDLWLMAGCMFVCLPQAVLVGCRGV